MIASASDIHLFFLLPVYTISTPVGHSFFPHRVYVTPKWMNNKYMLVYAALLNSSKSVKSLVRSSPVVRQTDYLLPFSQFDLNFYMHEIFSTGRYANINRSINQYQVIKWSISYLKFEMINTVDAAIYKDLL